MSCSRKEEIYYHVARNEATTSTFIGTPGIGGEANSLVKGGSRYYFVGQQEQQFHEQDQQLNSIFQSIPSNSVSSSNIGYHHARKVANPNVVHLPPEVAERGLYSSNPHPHMNHPLVTNNVNSVEVPVKNLTSPGTLVDAPPASFTYNSYANQHNFFGEIKPGTYHDSHPFYSHPNRVDEPQGMAPVKYYL
jgi:hypothetical protein